MKMKQIYRVVGLVIWLATVQTSLGFYNPSPGRWLSRDSIEENGGDNIHSFCRNDPLFSIDTLGLYTMSGGIVTIENGDTLWAISRGTGIPLADLLAANGGSSLIKIGQRLGVGPKPPRPVPPVPKPPKPAPQPPLPPPPNPPHTTTTSKCGPVCSSGFWTAEVTYQAIGLMYVHGSFTGNAKCSSDKSIRASISGSADGMGLQGGYINGKSTVGFWAKSSTRLAGQTAGIFLASAGIGIGPINIFEVSGNVGSAPEQIVSGDLDVNIGPGTDFSVLDCLEAPKLGAGGGLGFIGLRIKKVY